METEFDVEHSRRQYRNREYLHEVCVALVEEGRVGLTVPEGRGGRGGSHVVQSALLEALGTYVYGFGILVLTAKTVVENVLRSGTEAQRDPFNRSCSTATFDSPSV